MKFFHFLFALLISGTVFGNDYYVDANATSTTGIGTMADPFKTIAQVNSASFAATGGNNIYFKRDGVYYGGLIIQANNTTVTAYGTGANPIISGFSVVSGWTTTASPNIWQANVPQAPQKRLNVFVYGTTIAELGRYPNPNSTDGGFLKYESFTGTGSITDNEIPNSSLFNNADILVKKDDYIAERRSIDNISGNTINFKPVTLSTDPASSSSKGEIINPYTYTIFPGKNNYGYFIENSWDPLVLDRHTEWAFDPATRTLYAYFAYPPTTSSNVAKVSTIEKLIDINFYNNTTITNVDFEGGNQFAIYGSKTANGGKLTGVTVTGCRISTIGGRGIGLYGMDNVSIQLCWIQLCFATAVQVAWPTTSTNDYRNSNCNISQNTIVEIAPFIGMSSFNDAGDANAVYANISSTLTVESNVITGVGKSAIAWQGSDVSIKKNKIQNAVKDFKDQGAIYTFLNTSDPYPYPSGYTTRTIASNTIYDCQGSGFGTASPDKITAIGIYLDGRTPNVSVENNNIYNIRTTGISSNTPVGVSMTGNTIFNCDRSITFTHRSGWITGNINVNIKRNILYSTVATHAALHYINNNLNTTLSADLATIGTIDSNYYGHVNPVPLEVEANYPSNTPLQISPMKLASWQAKSGLDLNSHEINPITLYTINSLGSNLITNLDNGQLITGFGNVQASPANSGSYITRSWDATNQRLICTMNDANLTANIYPSISAPFSNTTLNTGLDGGNRYIFRFQTIGSSNDGIAKVLLRTSGLGGSNYDLTTAQVATFGPGPDPENHEFLFTALSTYHPGAFQIALERNSGTTTAIDNIQLFQADITDIPVTDVVQFISNPWSIAQSRPIPPGTFRDVYGTIYTGGSAMVPAWGSKLLFRVPASPRPAPANTAPGETTMPISINCYPNPAGDMININNLQLKDKWQTLTITGLNGNRVLRTRNISDQNKATINISSLAAGEYIAVFTDKKGKSSTIKFVKL